MEYGVRSISVGTFEEPGPAVFWMQRFDEWISLRLQLMLIRGAGRTVLVNTGLPDDLSGLQGLAISMSAALFAGLDRADAARFSFLMATPITAMAVAYEGLKLVRGEVVGAEPLTLVVGIVAAFVSGILAITVLLRYLETRSFTVFVVYRFVLAAVVLVTVLVRA